MIEFLQYLDESNLAYLLMIVLFLIFAYMQSSEIKRLRKMLRTAVLGSKR